MKQILHQQILLDKEDLWLLKKEGLNIAIPGGNTISLGWQNGNGVHHIKDDITETNELAGVRCGPKGFLPEKITEILRRNGPLSWGDLIKSGKFVRGSLNSALRLGLKKKMFFKAADGLWKLNKKGAHSNGK